MPRVEPFGKTMSCFSSEHAVLGAIGNEKTP